MELETSPPANSTAPYGEFAVSSTDGSDPSHQVESGAAVTALISEAAIRNSYVAIGTIGFVGNLFVIFIITCYTNLTDKVLS